MSKKGRPTTYTPEIADEICMRLVSGNDGYPESMRSICSSEGMPAQKVVYDWLLKHPEFSEKYARARELQQEARLEEIHEIADNSTDDVMFLTSEDNNGEGAKAAIKHSAIARARLQIDTRKWAMSKLAPKKYGETKTHTIEGNVSVHIQSDLKILEDAGVKPELLELARNQEGIYEDKESVH